MTGEELFGKVTDEGAKKIADYLASNASDELQAKISYAKAEGVALADCMDYIKSEARKQAVNGCAVIEDGVVYGWAVHFFEDEWETRKKPEPKPVAKPEPKPAPKPSPKTEKKRTSDSQYDGDLFSCVFKTRDFERSRQ